MKEFYSPIEKAFRNGLRPDERMAVSLDYLERLEGMKASEFGLVPHTDVDWPTVGVPTPPPPQSTTVTAVIKLNTEAWFQAKIDKNEYGTWRLDNAMAPLAVHFEGWESSPRDQIVSYWWDFGDGSPDAEGYTAAHIYETPGTYTVTLTVTGRDGSTSTATHEIRVLARTGRRFYVDADLGDDNNDGLSTSTPWKSATKAFAGMNGTSSGPVYLPGDRISFKRGCTNPYDFQNGTITPIHGKTGYGYVFDSGWGNGALPLIRRTGASTTAFFNIRSGMDIAFITFQDLIFKCGEDDLSDSINLWDETVRGCVITFLRVEAYNFHQCISITSAYTGPQTITNIGLYGCNFHDSRNTQIFATVHRLAMVGCTFDTSANHLCYLSWLNSAYIDSCTFKKPSFGRNAIRFSASSGNFELPAHDIVFTNNTLEGWIDPIARQGGNGQRYNFLLVTIGPNRGDIMEGLDWIYFKGNTISGFEGAVGIAAADHVDILENTFTTVSAASQGGAVPGRIYVGGSFERKPCRHIRIMDNTVTSRGTASSGGRIPIFYVNDYDHAFPYQGDYYHKDITFGGNTCTFTTAQGLALVIEPTVPAEQAEVRSSNTWTGVNRAVDPVIKVGATTMTLDAFYAATGWEPSTLFDFDPDPEVPGDTIEPLPAADWPFPQLMLGRKLALVGYEDSLFAVNTNNWIAEKLATKDASDPGPITANKAIEPGGVWHHAMFDEIFFATNGVSTVIGSPHVTGAWDYFTGDSVTVKTLCGTGNYLVLGGLGAPLHFTSQIWQEAWRLWKAQTGFVVNESSEIDPGYLLYGTAGAQDWPFSLSLALLGYPTGLFEKVRGLIAERVASGQIGFVPTTRQILSVQGFRGGAVIYGADGIGFAAPSEKGWSYSDWGKLAIAGRGCAGGDDTVQVFVDSQGDLYRIDDKSGPKKLGYREYLKPLVDANGEHPVVVTFDSVEGEFYIGNGQTCYVLRGSALSSKDVSHSSLTRFNGELLGYNFGTDTGAVVWQTGAVDHSQRGLKTMATVEVAYEDISEPRINTPYRYGPEEAWRDDLEDIRLNEEGAASPIITANDYKLRFEGARGPYARVNYAVLRWKLCGMKTIRGLYGQE